MIFQINVDFSKVLLVTSALVGEQNNSLCRVPIKALNTANSCFLTLVFISRSPETQQRGRIKLLLTPTAFGPVWFRVGTCHCGFGLCIVMLKLKEIPIEAGGSLQGPEENLQRVGPGCLVVSPCRGSAVWKPTSPAGKVWGSRWAEVRTRIGRPGRSRWFPSYEMRHTEATLEGKEI